MLVDGTHDRGHDDGEGVIRARLAAHLRAVEEVDAVGGAERKVVVLARAVDAHEGLLVQQADEAVLGGDLLDELHDHQVLVDLVGGDAKVGRALVLVGRDLAVARL